MNRFQSLIAAAALTLAAAAPALAHHAVNAQFDPDKYIPSSGVLTKFELINPHSYLHVDIKNAQGVYENWTFETGAPSALRSAGIASKDAFKLGETYKFSYHPARDGTHTGLVTQWELPDGRKIGFGPAKDFGVKS